MRNWIFVTAALMAAAPASAQVTLVSGQGVSVTIGKSGASAEPVHAAALGDDDLEALGMMRKSYETNPAAHSNTPTVLAPEPITNVRVPGRPVVPGRIEIVFEVVEGKDTVLAIRNGYPQGLTYRARITRAGRSGPTDVCLVMPGKRGYEHWPYVIDKIELTELTLVDWKAEDGVPCR